MLEPLLQEINLVLAKYGYHITKIQTRSEPLTPRPDAGSDAFTNRPDGCPNPSTPLSDLDRKRQKVLQLIARGRPQV